MIRDYYLEALDWDKIVVISIIGNQEEIHFLHLKRSDLKLSEFKSPTVSFSGMVTRLSAAK